MAHAGLAGGRSLAYTYEYDKNGNRMKIALADSAGTMSSDTAYTYDALGRLTSEVRTGGSANYTKYYYFDSVGNRTFLLEFAGPPGPPVVTSYAYNAGEQLTALTKSYNGVVSENRTYQYDAAGQMTQVADTAAGVTKTFSWDHLGRMTHAEVNNGGVTKSVDYANNPAGLRFMRVAGGVTKAWTYQGDNIASVESTTSPTLHSVYSGSGLGGVAERHDVDTAGAGSTTSRFYLYNHRGDVVGVSDASGALTSAYDYDAYGAVSQSAQSGGGSAPTDDILFTGKDLDPDTGLYYFNARWYDSESGRFVSRTGLRPDAERPYEFCGGNPIYLVDTNGLYATPWHILLAYEAMKLLGYPDWLAWALALADAYADYRPGSDTHPNWHGMAKPGQSCGDAEKATRQYMDEEGSAGNLFDLGYGLHAADDIHAREHNFKTDYWEGHYLLALLFDPNFRRHLWADLTPSPAELQASLLEDIRYLQAHGF